MNVVIKNINILLIILYIYAKNIKIHVTEEVINMMLSGISGSTTSILTACFGPVAQS